MTKAIAMSARPPSRSRLTIGELARQAGVGVETIRFYERKGLIARPLRPVSGFRIYPEQAISALAFLREAQELGFTLREINDLLALRDDSGTDAAAIRARTVLKAAQIENRITQLERRRMMLRQLLAACPGRGKLERCSIINKLSAKSGLITARRARSARKATMKTAELTIEGMHCDGCAKTIEALLRAEPGIKVSSVSYAGGSARVLYDADTIDLSRIVAAVERAGYRVMKSA